MDRLSVAEAASALGITQAAVYKRIQRGTIEHDKDSEGRVFVYLDTSDIQADKSTDASMDESNRDDLIAELRAHNEYLRREGEAWQEESRRKDTIIMSLTQRIPELEAAREPRESPETTSEGEENEGPEEPKRQPWWRRIFG